MALEPSIILSGQPVNVLGALSAGNQVAQQTNDIRRQNALAQLYRDQGAGILAGDHGALNALAGQDPMAALNVQSTQQGMRAREQEIATAKENARLRALELTANMDAATRKAEADKIDRGLAAATQINDPATWDQFMAQSGLQDYVGKFDQKDILIAGAAGLSEALKMNAPAKPADEYQRYVQEETAKGRQPLSRIDFAQAIKGKGTVVYDPTTGNPLVEIGGGKAGGAGTPTDINPFNVETMTSEIDAIMNDPSLPKITGPIEGGGGNLVDDLNLAQRVYYGSDGLALIEKVGKLQGTTWLAARQFLKGGGPITDYESRKAESAISRLSRVKDDKEFKAALKDLRDAVTSGAEKLRVANGGQPSTSAPTVIDGYTIEQVD